MTKPKIKQITDNEKRSPYGRSLPAAPASGEKQSASVKQLTKLWQSEIQALMKQNFSSVESAVDCIIDRVTARLSIEGQAKEQTREFMRTMLLTDPAIIDQLKRDLRLSI